MKNNNNLKLITIAFLFLVFSNIQLFAHPHFWFTSEVEFLFSDSKIKGAFVTWTFDESFSNEVINDYDTDKNGKFNIKETMDVYDNAFIYTQNYYYFIFIRQGKNRTSPKNIAKSTFSVHQKDGIVSYRFFVDLTKLKGNEFFFACYDYTFFCDISYPEDAPVSFIGDMKNIKPKYKIEENKDLPVYYNPISPLGDNRLYSEWKPGLKVYYPKEIKVSY